MSETAAPMSFSEAWALKERLDAERRQAERDALWEEAARQVAAGGADHIPAHIRALVAAAAAPGPS